MIAVINKTDLGNRVTPDDFKRITSYTVSVSAREQTGREDLVELIESIYIGGEIEYGTACVVTNARQYASVCNSIGHIESACLALEAGFTQDVAGMELELALSELGDLDGRSVTNDVVSNIFGRFCVGK